MLKVKGLSHIQINVSDMERSLRFYRDWLGLIERMRTGGFVLLSPPGSPDFISLRESARLALPGWAISGCTSESISRRRSRQSKAEAANCYRGANFRTIPTPWWLTPTAT